MRSGSRNWAKWVAAIAVGLAGCAQVHEPRPVDTPPPLQVVPVQPPGSTTPPRIPKAEPTSVRRASSVEVLVPAGQSDPPSTDVPTSAKLTERDVIESVLRQNPTLTQMRAAAEAAQARYPQVTSLDDPMVTIWTAPGSYWSDHVDAAARAELAQKLPWPGKRELRGQAALAEASAAARELEVARLDLIEAARVALADYGLAERVLAVNKESLELLALSRRNAETRVRNGLAPQQDINQANVELARQEERAVALERARKVAQARLNTLMHQPPDAALPAPPDDAPTPTDLPDVASLRAKATAARPDLKALADRIRADEATAALAEQEYKPDVEVMAAYDGFWQGTDRSLQWQIGARVNIPIQYARRDAAVAEARARVARRRAELAKLTDQIAFRVQEAAEQVRESRKVIELYEQKILPAARANVKEAQSAYMNAKVPFLNLAGAQRTLIEQRERHLEAQAELRRRWAVLDRLIGEPSDPAHGRP
ncbi:MAG TPA: TolC family protein [Gemmataceae bacterium]|nr:TolC family protein [Gemmataceae bacterium]